MVNMEHLTDQERVRRDKLEQLKEWMIDPFGQAFDVLDYSVEIKQTYEHLSKEELHEMEDKTNVRFAGRIMTKRGKGKAAFAHIQDAKGQVQVYVRKDQVGDESFELFTKADLGDILGFDGYVMKTNTGEVTVRVTKLTHLSKSLRPLPEKWHGLSNVEEKYRRRYVDLIVNEETKNTFYVRSMILHSIRELLHNKGFMEVETPILHPILGGASARPFVTHHNTLDMPFYLRIAPELYLKRLLVGGFDKVFELGRTFRNEGMSIKHNPEFTMLELYEAFGSVESMMSLTEEVFTTIAKKLGLTSLTYQGVTIDITSPWRKAHMVDLVKEELGIDFFRKDLTFEEAKSFALEKGLEIEDHWTSNGYILNGLFEAFCESKITDPTFVMGHPIEISPLAKKNQEDPRYTDRFELLILGREYANAFSELNDPVDQKARFEAQLKEKELGNVEATEMDIDYVEALEYGMPPAGGLGIGIDRMIMLFTNSASIRDVLLFPHMKPRG
jgi:lysyl-tRNA synthetase class 2